MEVSQATINEIYNLLRANTAAITAVNASVTAAVAEVDKKVAVLIAAREIKDKDCDDHQKETDSNGRHIRALELWRAGQEGVAGFCRTWAPVAISAAALYFAIAKGGGH